MFNFRSSPEEADVELHVDEAGIDDALAGRGPPVMHNQSLLRRAKTKEESQLEERWAKQYQRTLTAAGGFSGDQSGPIPVQNSGMPTLFAKSMTTPFVRAPSNLSQLGHPAYQQQPQQQPQQQQYPYHPQEPQYTSQAPYSPQDGAMPVAPAVAVGVASGYQDLPVVEAVIVGHVGGQQDLAAGAAAALRGRVQGNWRYMCVCKEGSLIYTAPDWSAETTGQMIEKGAIVTICERGIDQSGVTWLHIAGDCGWLHEAVANRQHPERLSMDLYQNFLDNHFLEGCDNKAMRELGAPHGKSKAGTVCVIDPELHRYVLLQKVPDPTIDSSNNSGPMVEPGGTVAIKEHISLTVQRPEVYEVKSKKNNTVMKKMTMTMTFAYVENIDVDGNEEGWIFDQVDSSESNKTAVLADVVSREAVSDEFAAFNRKALTTFSPGRGPDKPMRSFSSQIIKPGDVHEILEKISVRSPSSGTSVWYRLDGIGWVGETAKESQKKKAEPFMETFKIDQCQEVWACKELGGKVYETPCRAGKSVGKLRPRQRVIVSEKATFLASENIFLCTKVGWVPVTDSKGKRMMSRLGGLPGGAPPQAPPSQWSGGMPPGSCGGGKGGPPPSAGWQSGGSKGTGGWGGPPPGPGGCKGGGGGGWGGPPPSGGGCMGPPGPGGCKGGGGWGGPPSGGMGAGGSKGSGGWGGPPPGGAPGGGCKGGGGWGGPPPPAYGAGGGAYPGGAGGGGFGGSADVVRVDISVGASQQYGGGKGNPPGSYAGGPCGGGWGQAAPCGSPAW